MVGLSPSHVSHIDYFLTSGHTLGAQDQGAALTNNTTLIRDILEALSLEGFNEALSRSRAISVAEYRTKRAETHALQLVSSVVAL